MNGAVSAVDRPFDLDRVMAYQPPMLLVDKYVRDYGVSQSDTFEHFEEVKKFLAVCASDRSRSFAPSKALDEMWHTFVLFTPDYHQFCSLLGGYIHHRPAAIDQVAECRATRDRLRRVFGTINSSLWPEESAACCSD